MAQNTLALGAGLSMMGWFPALEEVLAEQFRKGTPWCRKIMAIARVGCEYATANFRPFAWPLP